jgi:hypothetical protein
MRNLIIFLFFGVLCLGCKTDNKSSTVSETSNVSALPTSAPIIGPATDPSKLTIPESCDMITTEDLKSILSVPAGAINVKNADNPEDKQSRSCFFKWDDVNTTNAGILISIQTNAVYADAPDYFTRNITSKLTEGETVLGNDKPNKYKRFNSGKGIGAYSFDQSRFYWTFNNDYMFMLAFNITTLSEAKMVTAAEKIVEKVNTNFASKVKN